MTGIARVRVPILDVEVTPRSIEELAEDLLVPQGRRLIVGHNLHSAYLVHTDDLFRTVYERADLVLVDGQPVRWCGRRAAPNARQWDRAHRIGSTDWLRAAGSAWTAKRVAVVGSTDEANLGSVAVLRNSLGTDVRGWPGAGWTDDLAKEVVSALKEFKPELTLIGLGMPLQERFFLEYESQLPDGTYALVGAAIDQLSGVQKRAPDWISRGGFEWLYRLCRHPRRLSRRYLLEPLLLVRVLFRRRIRS